MDKHRSVIVVFLFAVVCGFVGELAYRSYYGTRDNRADLAVLLESDGFHPDHSSVPVGASVIFHTRDDRYHNLVFRLKGSEFFPQVDTHGRSMSSSLSGIFGPDESYLLTFPRRGVYYVTDSVTDLGQMMIEVGDNEQ